MRVTYGKYRCIYADFTLTTLLTLSGIRYIHLVEPAFMLWYVFFLPNFMMCKILALNYTPQFSLPFILKPNGIIFAGMITFRIVWIMNALVMDVDVVLFLNGRNERMRLIIWTCLRSSSLGHLSLNSIFRCQKLEIDFKAPLTISFMCTGMVWE